MTADYQIQYIKHKNIDKRKWDACIEQSHNGLIYGYSFYLDHLANQWDALVLNNYEAVMPLTHRRKWGIQYLYQPAFTQQLGIFSHAIPSPELIAAFLLVVRKHFRFAEIFLNFQDPGTLFTTKANFILSLNHPYPTIASGYSNDAAKNIRRSEKFNLHYGVTDNFSNAILLYREAYGGRTKHITATDYANFKQLCLYARQKKILIVRQASDEKGALLAVALLLLQKQRLYLLQSTTLLNGRAKEANYFLLDNIIKEFADQDLLLDFEGSDIPGIAHFYMNFGAVNQPYYFWRYNHLAWPIRLLK